MTKSEFVKMQYGNLAIMRRGLQNIEDLKCSKKYKELMDNIGEHDPKFLEMLKHADSNAIDNFKELIQYLSTKLA